MKKRLQLLLFFSVCSQVVYSMAPVTAPWVSNALRLASISQSALHMHSSAQSLQTLSEARVSSDILYDVLKRDEHIQFAQPRQVAAYGGACGLGSSTRVLRMSAQSQEGFDEMYDRFLKELSGTEIEKRKSVYKEFLLMYDPEYPGGSDAAIKSLQKAWTTLNGVHPNKDNIEFNVFDLSKFVLAAKKSDFVALKRLFPKCERYEFKESLKQAAARHDFKVMGYLTILASSVEDIRLFLSDYLEPIFDQAVKERDFKMINVLLNQDNAAFDGLPNDIEDFEKKAYFNVYHGMILWAFSHAAKNSDFEMMDSLLQTCKLLNNHWLFSSVVDDFIDAARRGDSEVVKYIFNNFPDNITFPCFYHALLLACKNNDTETTKMLLTSKNFAWHVAFVAGSLGLLKYWRDNKKTLYKVDEVELHSYKHYID